MTEHDITTITEMYQYAHANGSDVMTILVAAALFVYLDRLDWRLDALDADWWTLSDRMELTEMTQFVLELASRTRNDVAR
jgi:hypothetical protein